jgi:hypothetical protein
MDPRSKRRGDAQGQNPASDLRTVQGRFDSQRVDTAWFQVVMQQREADVGGFGSRQAVIHGFWKQSVTRLYKVTW